MRAFVFEIVVQRNECRIARDQPFVESFPRPIGEAIDFVSEQIGSHALLGIGERILLRWPLEVLLCTAREIDYPPVRAVCRIGCDHDVRRPFG